jgi:hypothetical protein
MPSKSKRNRRVSQNKGANNTPISNMGAVSQVPNTQTEKTTVLYSNNQKSDVTIETLSGNFSRELKWISLVTAIIIILLAASYFLFR